MDFSSENMEDRRNWNNIFKGGKGREGRGEKEKGGKGKEKSNSYRASTSLTVIQHLLCGLCALSNFNFMVIT